MLVNLLRNIGDKNRCCMHERRKYKDLYFYFYYLPQILEC